MTQQSKHLYMFGPYRIDPTKRVLLRGEDAVQLPSKVFEILLVLVEHCEEVVSKDDLLCPSRPLRRVRLQNPKVPADQNPRWTDSSAVES